MNTGASIFPTLLGMPAPEIQTYPPEVVVAEKLRAIVHLAERNTRMKDFFDLRVLLESARLDRPRSSPWVQIRQSSRSRAKRKAVRIFSQSASETFPSLRTSRGDGIAPIPCALTQVSRSRMREGDNATSYRLPRNWLVHGT